MLIYILSSVFMYIMGLMSFCFKREHLLMMLLSLEFIVISLYFSMNVYMSYFNNEYYFLMVFLTMSVCEGALGLSLLVLMMRSFGNDFVQSFSLLW
uniref:NADH dehydrogenase subunit 4L n=1 Tax=Nigidius sinicus TaxID=2950530 RepID=UPI00211488F4|nr:NADH dehydrogenase subunit 4L [Nigidius sinicus]USR68905.1 NADH dehydrogenase subunit 4L [Nigidius sinicus]